MTLCGQKRHLFYAQFCLTFQVFDFSSLFCALEFSVLPDLMYILTSRTELESVNY